MEIIEKKVYKKLRPTVFEPIYLYLPEWLVIKSQVLKGYDEEEVENESNINE